MNKKKKIRKNLFKRCHQKRLTGYIYIYRITRNFYFYFHATSCIISTEYQPNKYTWKQNFLGCETLKQSNILSTIFAFEDLVSKHIFLSLLKHSFLRI
jgi:hypothetical protein